MKSIAAPQSLVTTLPAEWEPTNAELDAIEREMPLILAEVDLLDVEITLLDRPVTELDDRRLRRHRNRVLAARRHLANRAGLVQAGGVA
ncbi:DUF6284 family protein [Streptomyces sp. NPDC012637]|uniref:DUF6284 family protein n=1 Tax=Streptomyces sp. NPDC012637 TaxID=3364842 RepID=UPI0036E48522